MSKSFEKYQKRKLISSYFSVIISIALVLFFLVITSFLALRATDFRLASEKAESDLRGKENELDQVRKSYQDLLNETPDDIQYVTYPVLNHRIILTPEREMEGYDAREVVNDIIKKIEVPR